jgi:phosphoglycerol transferase MdoB-like AlkP superfamily enzyme
MDPIALTAQQWAQVKTLLHTLWLLPFFAAGLALLLLLSFAVIPSLVATRHLPPDTLRVRGLFLLVALAAVMGIAFVFARVIEAGEVVRAIYPRFLW